MDQKAHLESRDVRRDFVTSKRIAIAGLLLIVVAALVWLFAGDDLSDLATPTPTAAAACTFRVGQRWAYEAETSSHLRADLGAMLGGAARLSKQEIMQVPVTLKWRLTLVALDVTAEDTLVAAHWSDVSASGDTGAVTSGDDLDYPVLFRIRRDCAVSDVSRHKQATDAAARTQQAALLSLSFRVPLPGTEPGGRSIDTAIGTCKAWHSAQIVDERVQIKQRISECSTVRGAPEMRADPAMGDAVFKLDDKPWFAAIDGRRLVVMKRGKEVAVRLRSTLKVRRAAPQTDITAVDPADFEWRLVAAVPSEGQVAVRSWPGLDGMAAAAALMEIERLWRHGKDGTMSARAFARAWLQANPNSAGKLLAALRDAPVEEAIRAGIYHVVGRFGGAATRLALTGVLRDDDFSDGDRSRAALAIAALPKPDKNVLNALLDASNRAGKLAEKGTTVGHSATLALGMLNHEQRGKQSELVDAVNAHLRTASALPDEGLAAEALSAIGNSGDPALLDAVQARLSDPSEDVRAKAAYATRLMDPDQTAALMAAKLATEQNERVLARMADAGALAAMVHQKKLKADVIKGADTALRRAKTEVTKRALVQLLGAAGNDPVAKAALKALFDRGAKPDTLRLIGMHMTADELMP